MSQAVRWIAGTLLLALPLRAQQPSLGWWDAGTLTPVIGPEAVLALDLDGDGLPEHITSVAFAKQITIQAGRTDGVSSPLQIVDTPLVGLSDLASADFNLDGFPDLAGVCGFCFAVDDTSILLNDGHGGLLAQQAFTSGILNPEDLVAADVHSDGVPDVAAVSVNSSALSVMASDLAGGLHAPLAVYGWTGVPPPPGASQGQVPGAGGDDWSG